MSRTSKKTGLGKAILKDKSKRRRGAGKGQADSWLHSSELDDGYDWGRLNLRSVTEESKLDEFLNTAKLAGTEFTAEKLNIKVVDPGVYTGLPSVSEYAEIEQLQKDNKHYLNIPRRPKWDSSTTAEQLDQMERDAFLEWRRSLVQLEENEKLVLTPFERNLEFWRQLWRVIERSDVVVQIVDARNPLLFRSEDLEKYVKEIDSCKVNVVLISKADLLTPKQRNIWLMYFQETSSSITVAFWSANRETERIKEMEQSNQSSDIDPGSDSDQDSSVEPLELIDSSATDPVDSSSVEELEYSTTHGTCLQETATSIDNDVDTKSDSKDGVVISKVDDEMETDTSLEEDGPRLLTGEELVDLLLTVSPVKDGKLTTVGMVGYPNVGKSSTINALIQTKKVPVSATPGRTKHFQTLYLSESLLLCDCPGLVFPTFVSTKAEMVCSGILPIDQMRDHVPPISLVCTRIPRPVLEKAYGIRLPHPHEGEDPDRYPYAEELCGAYGYVRGYMTTHGRPDGPRSSRYILKDYVNGRLLYCHPPPGIDSKVFNQFLSTPEDQEEPDDPISDSEEEGQVSTTAEKVTVPKSEFDKEYFQQAQVRAIKKSVVGPGRPSDKVPQEGKHWKKHNNRHKKEKTRRTQPPAFY